MIRKSELNELSVNGTRLHYQEAGNGELVVLVHGTVADYRTWRKQFVELSRHYRAVNYSRRLHYPNDVNDPHEYSVQLHAEDLAQLIRYLADEPAHIVTASWGGNVALQLALTQPSLVRSIVLAEPPTLPLLANDNRYRYLLEEFRTNSFLPAQEAMLNGDYHQGLRYFVDGVIGEGTFDSLPTRAQRYFLDNAMEFKAEVAAKEYIPDFTPDILSQIQVPTLLLEGDRSPRFFHVILDLLQACLPHVERRIILNSSHGIHADNPKVYNSTVLDFLQRH